MRQPEKTSYQQYKNQVNGLTNDDDDDEDESEDIMGNYDMENDFDYR